MRLLACLRACVCVCIPLKLYESDFKPCLYIYVFMVVFREHVCELYFCANVFLFFACENVPGALFCVEFSFIIHSLIIMIMHRMFGVTWLHFRINKQREIIALDRQGTQQQWIVHGNSTFQRQKAKKKKKRISFWRHSFDDTTPLINCAANVVLIRARLQTSSVARSQQRLHVAGIGELGVSIRVRCTLSLLIRLSKGAVQKRCSTFANKRPGATSWSLTR